MPLDITRRGFLGATALAAAQAQAPRTPSKRPNLILCMADELRAESIACYGHPLVQTPNMDRLASQGTRFAQCHVQKHCARALAMQFPDRLARPRARASQPLLRPPSR